MNRALGIPILVRLGPDQADVFLGHLQRISGSERKGYM
jgi:hypothetical protein